MRSSRRPRFTIGQVMALIAVLAGLLGVPQLRTPVEFKVAACVIAFLPILFLVNVLVETLLGIPCPGCTRWTLRRLVRSSSYYRCSRCESRFKRFGFGPWLDASGPEDAPRYRGKAAVKRWVGFSTPQDPGETTTGLLLRNQRRRGPAGKKVR
jgi:hypothetical protein